MYNHEFYTSARWKRKRAAILKRDGYMDQVQKRYGKMVEATLVHHIFPLEDFPQFRYENWNLISVSLKTHNELHDRNTNQLTQKGMDLLARTARKQGMEEWISY